MAEPIRPATPPAIGRETAQAVLDIIRAFPAWHDQDSWENEQPESKHCHTTRCVAGWAQWLHEGRVVSFIELDDRDRGDNWLDYPDHVAVAGARYLGLPHDPDSLSDYSTGATRLFYHTYEQEAVRALEFLARGEPIDWDVVYGYDV